MGGGAAAVGALGHEYVEGPAGIRADGDGEGAREGPPLIVCHRAASKWRSSEFWVAGFVLV